MFAFEIDKDQPVADFYHELNLMADGLLSSEANPVAGMANLASLLFHTLPDINWAGFYIMRDGELVLGPFHGLPACTRIPVGKGVCGTAVAEKKVMLVEDVDAFPGHIACDSASRSEIVLPISINGQVVAVLDIDSPEPARFTSDDQKGLEVTVEHVQKHLRLSELLAPAA
ncbi:GAF domain-containing protein [Parendozoicomonas haliclonae]|uniref:Free methionine-R-sulfoxide reductase n=2 Tax=Parendozoicomonas haliclonae TaxID=1960125 RepID=A0A1X7AGS0_9GAMM|nr:Free methionine-R-sulfoxide reductase [Parendozoicomonas haliclonae]